MTFGDMVRKKENINVKASDLEAEVANDPCQSSLLKPGPKIYMSTTETTTFMITMMIKANVYLQ